MKIINNNQKKTDIMAQRTGFILKVDNSDDKNRVFAVSCDVETDAAGNRSVSNIQVSKDGVNVANFSVSRNSPEAAPSVSVNFYGLPMSEHAGCIAEVYAFIAQAMEQAAECGLDA